MSRYYSLLKPFRIIYNSVFCTCNLQSDIQFIIINFQYIVNTELYTQNCKSKRPRSISTHGVVFRRQFYKRDSVFHRGGISIIYLRRQSLGIFSNLPIPVPEGSGRAVLPGIYLVLQPMRFTLPACHHATT